MNQQTKKCGRCNVIKSINDFNKAVRGLYKVKSHCKACQKELKRLWYLKHRKEQIDLANNYSKTPKAISTRHKRYEQNKVTICQKNNEHRKQPHVKAQINKNARERYKTDINYKLRKNLRSRIRKAIKFNIKSAYTVELLGCSVDELKIHLEQQFKIGMSWDNYSFYGWHIDHIKPCDAFDLSDPEQQKKCFHYTNLQPLWAEENFTKNNKFER